MSVALYGIKSCDIVAKARAFLNAAGIEHRFVDYRAEGLDPDLLDAWLSQVGWETLMNRAGTTFRALPPADKAALDAARARALMLAQPTLIKRPVLVAGERLLVGFDPQAYAGCLGAPAS